MAQGLITALLLSLIGFSGQPESLESLLQRCQNMRTSISNQGGLAPGDLNAVKNLREDLTSWNDSNEDFTLLAAELQLSIWLNEIEQCNRLFERLIELQPDNSRIALAWADYQLKYSQANPDDIYGDLIKQFPNSSDIVVNWSKYLDSKNRFSEAIAALENLDINDLYKPDIAGLYASLLYADNRFQEAIDALDSVDSEELKKNPIQSSKFQSDKTKYEKIAVDWAEEMSIREVEEAAGDLPQAIILTEKGPIQLELFEDHAPNTVANFITLAEDGFYDGTRFHRVLPKFMAQGGDPNSREDATGQAGVGGPGYSIKDEHTDPDARNHFAGSLSMAKTPSPNSGGSQFFLTHLPTTHLDGRHTVFGRITGGLDIARKIELNDDIISISIIAKRDHDYIPEKIGAKEENIKTDKKPITKGNPGITTSSQGNN